MRRDRAKEKGETESEERETAKEKGETESEERESEREGRNRV